MMPEAGGQFIYLKRAFGKLTAFVYGWTVFLVIQTGVFAAVAMAFAKYCGVFFPFIDEKNILFSVGKVSISSAQVLAIASLIVLTWINMKGLNHGKFIQRIFTSTKIIALLLLILVGLAFGWNSPTSHSNFTNSFQAYQTSFQSGQITQIPLSGLALFSAIGVAMIGALFSSDAWNNVTFIAGEVKNPHRNIPLGLFIGVSLVSILYILANLAYFMLLPVQGNPNGSTVVSQGIMYAQNDRVGAAALFVVMGDLSKYLMAGLIVISTFGCNNGLILSGARLFQSMATHDLFFTQARELNKHGVPGKSMIFQAIWASLLCLSGSYLQLLTYSTFASLIFYIVTICGIFVLRRKEPDTPRPYRSLGYPLAPMAYIIIAGLICLNLLIVNPKNSGLGVLIMLLGIPVFYLFDRKKYQ
jgi:APA family basic amino acid/polyamine antiporter